MASRPEFVQYVADQLEGAGSITYRKMFGEYGMYCDGKIFALICDDQLFIKITEAGKKAAPHLEIAPPYEGAKPYFLIEDIDDREFLTEFVAETCKELSLPKQTVFDYKKEYKEFYLPSKKPGIINIPEMNYIAVRGKGDPNEPDGEYKAAMSLLYGIAFTIKMSYKGGHKIDGYFSYVVPPLEGLWWQADGGEIDFRHKENFQWIAMIRLPEFVTREEFQWAIDEATAKKKSDFSKVEFFTYKEGLCVQCMHVGSYDEESETICQMNDYICKQGYCLDQSQTRFHHEIYLSDPRRTAPEKLRTVIRQPICKG